MANTTKGQPPKRAAAAGGYRLVVFPKEFERNIFENIDKRFYLILVGSFVFIFMFVIILANTEYSDEALQNLLKEKYIQRAFTTEFEDTFEQEDTEEEGITIDEGQGQDQQEDERAQRDEGRRQEATGASAAERAQRARAQARARAAARAQMQQQVAGTGILGELSSSGAGGSGDAVYDVLGETGAGGVGDLENVLGQVGGLQSASSSNRRSSLGERSGGGSGRGTAGIDDLISGGVGQTGSVSINRDASFGIKGVEGSVSGKGTRSTARSQDAIGRVVAKHADAIENCYRRESRLNPNLKGSVTVQFVISPDGRVTDVRILDSSLRNRNVENCISRRVKTWRFDRIDAGEGDVTARYKWIFST